MIAFRIAADVCWTVRIEPGVGIAKRLKAPTALREALACFAQRGLVVLLVPRLCVMNIYLFDYYRSFFLFWYVFC